MEEEKGQRQVRGFLKGLRDFLEVIEDMDERGETMRTGQGRTKVPMGGAAYKYSLKLGIDEDDFPLPSGRAFHPRPRPAAHIRSIERDQVLNEREPLMDIFDEDGHISVVVELPGVKEEDLGVKVADNVLVITARTPEGVFVRDIPVPEGETVETVEEASFTNGVLEVRLRKKGGR